METLSQAIDRLQAAGYHTNFRASRGKLACDECGQVVDPSEVSVIEIVRFDGANDPGDGAILYALDAGAGHRGLYAAAYGADVSADDMAVIRSLPDHNSPSTA
ncbi:MAG: hypothetical protein R2704_12120 [Microthrixaceae bacterium]